MKTVNSLASCAVVGAALLMPAAEARGQAVPRTPTPIPAVEVVATRIPKAPHEVPASVEIITGADLRARNATTLREALALATGISIAPGGDAGPASAVPEVWGLREFDAFLLVVDDVPWGGAFNPAVATLSLRDVERVEILRGPAPVTYGATSFVGVIHVVHTAAAARAQHAELHGGSFGSGGGALDLALPSAAGWVSRLSGDVDRERFKDDHTGYSRGHALLRTSRSAGSARSWFTADVNVLNQDPASPHPRQGGALSAAVPLDANHNPSNAYLDENRIAVATGLQRTAGNGTQWGTTASYTFSTQSMFRGFLTDVANGPNNAAGFKENIELQHLYADSHLIWPSVAGVQFMAGVDALFGNGEAKGATFTYSAPVNGSSRATVPEPVTLDKDAEARRLFTGAYGSVDWQPSTRVTLSAGLRLNATTERRGEGASTSHTRPSGSVGAIASLWERGDDHARVFANYRDTFKPAAFDFSLAENEGILDPETSRSYEVGLKFRLLRGLVDVEASTFRMDFENLVTATVVNNVPALINAGTTRFQGVEVAADVRLPSALFLRGSYSFHDGKFVNFVQSFDNVLTQLGGRRFEMSARHLASAGLTFAPELGIVASVTASYSGDRYLNKRNTALVAPFTVLDAGIGYRLDRAELRLDGRNLGDRRDAVSESEFGDAQYYRMPARSIRAGIAVRY